MPRTPISGRRAGRRLAAALILLGAGCSPIEEMRDLTGLSRNDPGPAAPYGHELSAAETTGYPNLATVPPPPTRALSAAERQKLTQSLVAERSSVERSDQRLRSDYPAPPSGPIRRQPARPGEAPAELATSAANPSATSAQPQPAAAPLRAPTAAASLTTPQLHAPPPEPQAFTPPPPPPRLAAAPTPTPAANSEPAMRTPPNLPAAMAAAGYQPPPALPSLAPPPPPERPVIGKVKAPPPPPATVERLGEIDFPGNATQLPPAADAAVLERAALLYRQDAGRIRIIGHAGRLEGAVAQLNSFHAALDRAQAVAAALAQKGVPADRIRVEAAPAAGDTGSGRAEILLER